MSDEMTVEQLVVEEIIRRADMHGLVYHVSSTKNPAPTVEGADHIDVGNVRIYGPAGWKLGFMIQNQFRPAMPHRFITLSEIKTTSTELIERIEKDRLEKERLAEIGRKHRQAAKEESEALLREAMNEKQEAPGPDVTSAS